MSVTHCWIWLRTVGSFVFKMSLVVLLNRTMSSCGCKSPNLCVALFSRYCKQVWKPAKLLLSHIALYVFECNSVWIIGVDLFCKFCNVFRSWGTVSSSRLPCAVSLVSKLANQLSWAIIDFVSSGGCKSQAALWFGKCLEARGKWTCSSELGKAAFCFSTWWEIHGSYKWYWLQLEKKKPKFNTEILLECSQSRKVFVS